jgi:amino acid transporter
LAATLFTRILEYDAMFQRKLSRIETAALSVAVIAMTVGMSLNTPFIAGPAGAAVPLVFIISTIGVLCIACSFVRLSSRVSHAGSVYGLIRFAQGRSVGFIAGWALLLTYALFVPAALCGFGVFAAMLLSGVHIPWIFYSLLCGVVVWFTNDRDIKLSARLLLMIEGVSIALITLVSIVIFIKQPLTLQPFKLGSAGLVGFSQGLVFGIMTFVGFEAAASLGEEAKHPARDVPFAIIATVIAAGIFFTFVSYAQTIGYGVANISALAGAATPMNDLATRFLGSTATRAIELCCAVSTFAMALGSAAASSRLLLALSRDGFFTPKLVSLNRFGSPAFAGNLIMSLNFVILIALVIWHNNASDLYGYTSTVATFTVIIAYGMMAVATLTKFWREDLAAGKLYLTALPAVGIVLLAYTLFVNIYPVPAFPFNVLPYIVVAYMVVGFVILAKVRKAEIQGDISSYVVGQNGLPAAESTNFQAGE